MSGKTILYVEDNEFNRKIVRQLLAKTTYRLREAVDGEEGVASALATPPDLILMDIQLPKMSGLDARDSSATTPEPPRWPIIVVTSFAPQRRRAEGDRRRRAPRTWPSPTVRARCSPRSARSCPRAEPTGGNACDGSRPRSFSRLAARDSRRDTGGQEEQFTPEFKEAPHLLRREAHAQLSAPDSVKRGQWFDVTVTVGAGGEHPSLSEHHVRYIALYKDTAEIARVYLHPVFSAPRVTFTIALDEGGRLRALAEPTHSAAWEASKADQRGALSSTVTRASSTPTLTSRLEVPSVSCQICSTYLRRDVCGSTNSPASLLSA